MAVPTYDKFIEPLLRFLASRPDGVSIVRVLHAASDGWSLLGLAD